MDYSLLMYWKQALAQITDDAQELVLSDIPMVDYVPKRTSTDL